MSVRASTSGATPPEHRTEFITTPANAICILERACAALGVTAPRTEHYADEWYRVEHAPILHAQPDTTPPDEQCAAAFDNVPGAAKKFVTRLDVRRDYVCVPGASIAIERVTFPGGDVLYVCTIDAPLGLASLVVGDARDVRVADPVHAGTAAVRRLVSTVCRHESGAHAH